MNYFWLVREVNPNAYLFTRDCLYDVIYAISLAGAKKVTVGSVTKQADSASFGVVTRSIVQFRFLKTLS